MDKNGPHSSPGGGKFTLPEGGKSRRVFLLLRDAIAGGQYPADSLLPSEQRLAAMHDVSRVTVRRALDALAADGLIEKRAGAGSAVRAAVPAMAADMTTFIPQIVAMGRQTEVRLLSFSYDEAPPQVAAALKLARGALVQRAVRIRLVRGRPFSHLTTFVPEAIASNFSEADLANTPLFELLERGGARIESARQSVTAALATPEVAPALGVSVGSALLALTRTVYDDAGRGIEYLSAFYRPDLFRLDMAMARVGTGGGRQWQPVIGGASEETPS